MILRTSLHRARIEHRCCLCFKVIPAGQRYERVVVKDPEEGFGSFAQHIGQHCVRYG